MNDKLKFYFVLFLFFIFGGFFVCFSFFSFLLVCFFLGKNKNPGNENEFIMVY